MKAALYYGREDVRIEEKERPNPGPGEVRIAVEACGICGTDLHEYADGPFAIPDGSPHPLTGEALPVTLGHEFAGVVAETGADVESIAEGEEVVVNPLVACRVCRYCTDGRYWLCETVGSIGLHRDGGLAESVVVPAESAVPIPESVPLEHGALVEPLSVAIRAVEQAGIFATERDRGDRTTARRFVRVHGRPGLAPRGVRNDASPPPERPARRRADDNCPDRSGEHRRGRIRAVTRHRK